MFTGNIGDSTHLLVESPPRFSYNDVLNYGTCIDWSCFMVVILLVYIVTIINSRIEIPSAGIDVAGVFRFLSLMALL